MLFIIAVVGFGILARALPENSVNTNATTNAAFDAILDASLDGNAIANETISTTFNGTLDAAYKTAEYVIENCNTDQLTLLKPALERARFHALQLAVDSRRGIHGSKAFKIMFKSNAFVDKIADVWLNMWEANPTGQPPEPRSVASFYCVTKYDLGYEYCAQFYTIHGFDELAKLLPIIGLCPHIFTLPAGGERYNPNLCPEVFENKFRPKGGHTNPFPPTLADKILDGLLWPYVYTKKSPGRGDTYIDIMNKAVKKNIFESSAQLLNYHVYSRLFLYECQELPNLFQPPWINNVTGVEANTSSLATATQPSTSSSQPGSSIFGSSLFYSSLPSASSRGPLVTPALQQNEEYNVVDSTPDVEAA